MHIDEEKYLAQVIKSSMGEAIKPFTEELADLHLKYQSLNQTVHGANNNDGEGSLVGDVTTLKKQEIDQRIFKRELKVWGTVVSGGVAAAVTYGREIIHFIFSSQK